MAEYRLEDLARLSGVSARNIRAYRERGLLDPPRRVGRTAYYDDYHLSQLKTINQLLRRGFNSAHIAEFFTSMRKGADLADILGIQQAILGPQADDDRDDSTARTPDTPAIDIDPDCDEVVRLVERGLGALIDGKLVLKDPAMAAIVARTSDPLPYLHAIARISESTAESVDTVAQTYVHALEELYAARFGAAHVPKAEEVAELSRVVLDYRDLGTRVIATGLEAAVREQLVTAVSEFTAAILAGGAGT